MIPRAVVIFTVLLAGCGAGGTGSRETDIGEGPSTSLDAACFGAVLPLEFDLGLPFVEVTVGAGSTAERGAFLVDLATTASTIDLQAFSPGLAAGAWGCDPFPEAVVFVKRTPPAAKKCGGIGTWTAPAAQIGASFYDAFGAIVFDPFSSKVWVAGR